MPLQVVAVLLRLQDVRLRQPGQRIEFDLALPHRVRRWVYEVGARVPVNTPLGPLETLHVRPVPITTALPEAAAEAVRRGGSLLSAQIWYAPTLQMLPVRIRIDPGQAQAGFLEPGLSVVVTVDQRAAPPDKSARAGALIVGHDG